MLTPLQQLELERDAVYQQGKRDGRRQLQRELRELLEAAQVEK